MNEQEKILTDQRVVVANNKIIAIGNKTTTPKRRHSFYLNPKESELLKEYSRKHDITVIELFRKMIKQIVEEKP